MINLNNFKVLCVALSLGFAGTVCAAKPICLDRVNELTQTYIENASKELAESVQKDRDSLIATINASNMTDIQKAALIENIENQDKVIEDLKTQLQTISSAELNAKRLKKLKQQINEKYSRVLTKIHFSDLTCGQKAGLQDTLIQLKTSMDTFVRDTCPAEDSDTSL